MSSTEKVNEKIHIERNTVMETLVIPLFSRKVCTDCFGDFFRDEKAMELMNQLDYDFSSAEKKSKGKIVRFGALEVATRQKAFAFEAKEYLKTHPKASVVNMGCGLDQTGENLDNGSCEIYNLDFENVIEVRNRLLPQKERVHHIPCDLNDFSWFKKVKKENGTVFFASGVFYYFSLEQIQRLFNAMAEYFKDGILVFDIASRIAVKAAVRTWIKEADIRGVYTSFYVNSLDKDIRPWLKNATVTSKPYMTGYFDLHLPSITAFYRFSAKVADHVMKMKIIKIHFNRD